MVRLAQLHHMQPPRVQGFSQPDGKDRAAAAGIKKKGTPLGRHSPMDPQDQRRLGFSPYLPP